MRATEYVSASLEDNSLSDNELRGYIAMSGKGE